MSPVGSPKKDKKQLSIVDAFGVLQRCNQPCNFSNEVDTIHMKMKNLIV